MRASAASPWETTREDRYTGAHSRCQRRLKIGHIRRPKIGPLGTEGDEPQVVSFSFDLGVLRLGDEAEAESPSLRERQSSV